MAIDFDSITSGITAVDIVGAIVAIGYIIISPNFTMWAVDKVAGMFGYDPYDRDNKHED